MAAGGGATITAVTRLKKDYQKLIRDPVPYAIAAPLSSNILEWFILFFCLLNFKALCCDWCS
jgi:ubiquitin-protein ligase